MTERAALLDALLSDPSKAREVPRVEAEALLVGIAAVERALELALIVPRPGTPTERRDEPVASRLLTLPEAAERARKSVRWIRDHWRTEMPFAVRKGRTVLFPAADFERWLRRT